MICLSWGALGGIWHTSCGSVEWSQGHEMLWKQPWDSVQDAEVPIIPVPCLLVNTRISQFSQLCYERSIPVSCATDHTPDVLLKHFNLSPTHLTTSLSFFPSCSTLFPKWIFKGLSWHILLPNSKYIQSNNQHYCCQITQARKSTSGERFPRSSTESFKVAL